MGTFWTARWQGYRDARHDRAARRLLAWDIARAGAWALGFFGGCLANAALEKTAAANFMIGVSTFGTFLASFVLVVMNSAGQREMSLMPDAFRVRQMEERLKWLLSDQLVMVVSALGSALCALAWLAYAAVAGHAPLVVSASVFAFTALAALNAMRLPFQVWELQASALAEERERAMRRLNRENDARFGERSGP